MSLFSEVPYRDRLHKTLELGQAIADRWGREALIVKMAREIKTRANAETKRDEARAVRAWIQSHVKYFSDPHGAELVGDPLWVLQNGGDCDDLATLAAALLIALGHNARLAAVRWHGRTDYTHAVTVDLTAQVIVDPVSVEPEIWPPAPFKVAALLYITPAGDFAQLSGFFGKIVKAVAKPFTKVFKPHTLLGKVADPLGLMSRNIKWTYKAADVVGTAALAVTGAAAIGAAAGATGGFWAAAGSGAKLAGSYALKAASGAKGAIVGASKALAPLVAQAVMSKTGSGAEPIEPQQMQFQTPGFDPSMTPATDPGAYAAGGYGGGGGAATMGPDMPGAVVPVEDTMPQEGPGLGTLALIGGGAVLLFMLANRGKK